MLTFGLPSNERLRVLCLGAHSDDIEIGCGGTILRLTQQYPQLVCDWIVFSAHGQRAHEAQTSAERFLQHTHERRIRRLQFRDGFFPYQGAEIKDVFESLKATDPHLIFSHHRADLHQDHRVIAELTWNTFRNHLILEYEIPKYDGDLGAPNCFVHLDEHICHAKVSTLLDCFSTQRAKHWFTADTFYALMRLRGLESASPTGYAEAFHGRKLVL